MNTITRFRLATIWTTVCATSLMLIAPLSHASTSMTFKVTTGQSGQNVAIAASFLGWNTDRLILTETTEGTYEGRFPEPWAPWFEYKIVVNGKWIADPKNPNEADDGWGGSNSVYYTRFKEDPALTPQGVSSLKRTVFTLNDWAGRIRNITVLEPKSRCEPGEKSPTYYFQDGNDYLNQGRALVYFSNKMQALQSKPAKLQHSVKSCIFTGVFIPPVNRDEEYWPETDDSNAYLIWLTQTVVPYVETHFQTGNDRDRRTLVGASLGGLISGYFALKAPLLFGHVVSQSGSFWWENEKYLTLITEASKKPGFPKIDFWMSIGTYETPDMNVSNDHLSQALKDLGHSVTYYSIPVTHNWMSWRNQYSLWFKALK